MRSCRHHVAQGVLRNAVLALGIVALFVAPTARAQLVTINASFTGTTWDPGWTPAGTNYTPTLTAATGIDSPGNGWLRLTDTGTSEATSVRDTNQFNSANATIAVKFNYASYGGTGADGITFFLADASKNFATGAYGGSLGYANMNTGGTATPGMVGGYIGLGLDEYGNYATSNEGKHGGLGNSTALDAYPNAVSVRGPGNDQTGYNYLGGTAPFSPPFAFPNDTTRPTGAEARTFEVIITATNQLTVYMQAGANAPMLPLYTIDLSGYARPDSLIMGFTGATGGQTDIHEVQGLYLSSLAATLWTAGNGTNTWSTANNWNGYGGTTPAPGSDVLLDNHYVSTTQTIDVGAGTTRSIRSLQIDAPFSYILNNGTLEFNDQGVLGPVGIVVSQGHGAATHTINSNLLADQAIEIKNLSTGALNIGGNINTAGNTVTLDGDGTGVTTISGQISGTGNLVKNDNGTVVLSNATNSYSGGTTLGGGTLTVTNGNALGTGGVTLLSGTLGSTNSSTINNTLSLAGNAGLSNITTNGTLTQTGGSYTLDMANATQTGAVKLSDTNTAQTLTVNVDSGTSTISGIIQNGGSGAGGLAKAGIGTLVLSGNNTYTGGTTITGGTIQLGANDVLANTGALAIGSSGTLDLHGFSQQVGALTAAGGASINFGSTSGANTFIFGTYTPPTSGVLVINNWESTLDKLATTIVGQNVSTIYISGFGIAAEDPNPTSMGGNYPGAYLLRPGTANTVEWTGSSNNTWSTNGNWYGGARPGNTNVAVFDSRGTLQPNVTLNRAFSIAGIKFGNNGGAGSAAYNISGTNTLTLAATVPYIQQQNNYQDQRISVSTLTLANTTVADVTGSKNLIISSVINGAGGLIKDGTGAGKLVLTGNNTFSGGLYVNNGIVQAGNSGALGGAGVIMSDATTIELTGGITVTNAIAATGAGVGGAGAIHNISGTNALSGIITETGATTFAADAGTTLNLTGNLTGGNQDTFLAGAGNITASLITTGTGNVTLNGTGTVTFNGGTNNNTYTGLTTVNSGTLVLSKSANTTAIAGDLVIGDGAGAAGTTTVRLAASNQIGNTSLVTLNSDGKFDLNGNAETIGAFAGSGMIDNTNATTAATLTFGDTSVNTFSGLIQDSGASLSLVKQGTGKLIISGNNTYSGTTTLSAGILAIQANSALGTGAVTVANGGNLEISGGSSGGLTNVANAFYLNGNGTQANDGAIQSTGGNNMLTGAITLQSASRIQTEAGSTLTLTGNISGTGMGLTLDGGGNTIITGSILTGAAGTLTKDGAGYAILNPTANASNFTGATSILDGTLEIQKSAALGTTAGGVTVSSGGTLAVSGNITTGETPITLNGLGDNGTGALRNVGGANTLSGAVTLNSASSIGTSAGSMTLSGVVSGASGYDLTKTGSGTLTLSGTAANTFAGNFTVADGTVVLNKTAGLNAAGTGNLYIGDSTGASNSAVVQLGANGQIATGAAVAISSDGKLDVNGKTQTIGSLSDGTTGGGTVALGGGTLTVGNANNTAFSGAVNGGGTVIKTGTGTLTLTQTAGSNAFAPTTLTLTQGTVQLGASNILGTAVTFNGGTLSVNGFNETLTGATVAASSILDFNNLAGILNLTNGTYTGGTLTINNWAGSFTGGGASQLLLPGTITGSLLANITFTGYGAGAQLIGNEIVPITGTGYTWAVNADGNWTLNANWSPNTGNPNGVGQTANFTNAITAAHTVTLDAARTIGYLNFNSTNNYTIASATNRLTFAVSSGSAQMNVAGSGANTISAGINLSNALVINQNSTGALTLSNANAITGTAQNLTVNGSGNTTISGIIATTTGSLTKNNGGTLTLGGANTYTGGTTINGGVVAISNDNNLGGTSGAVTLNGGTLQTTAAVTLSATRSLTVNASGGIFQTDGNLTYAGVIAGTGTINKNGTGSLITGGASANTHTGDVNVNAGTFEIGKTAAVSALGDAADITVASGATLKFNGTGGYIAETIGSLSGAGTVNNAAANALTLTTGGNNASTLFSGVIQNTGTGALALVKTGTGTMTLTGANTYSGTTTVSQGVLNIQNGSALGLTTNGTSVAGNAALEIQGGINVGLESLTLNGTGVGGNGALRNVSDANSIAGAITLGSATTIKSEAGALTLSGAITGATQNLTLDGAGAITIAGAIGTTSGTVTKNGTGYTILSGTNTYTGATTINAGTLEIQSASALGTTAGGTTVAYGATLALGGTGTTFAAEPLTLNGWGIGSDGALRNISGNNTFAGAITLASNSVIGVDSGTTLTTTGVIAGNVAYSLTKVGLGTLVLNAANTYAGETNITEGTIQISADNRLGTAPTTATTGQLSFNGGTLNTTATMTLNTNRGIALGPVGGTIDVNSGTTLTYGGVLAGNSGGALTKQGAGTLVLSGTNTYNGATNLNAGTLSISSNANLGAANGTINFNGGILATTASLATTRTLNLGGGGGTLNVANGTTLTFGGALTGSGNLNLALNSTGTFLVNTNLDFSSGTLTLSGGTLSLSGINLSVGTLHITGNTILDFGNSSTSILNIGTLTVDPTASVTVVNWVNMVDYFFASNFTNATPDKRGTTPENQVTFTSPTSYPSSDTVWQSYDHQITPAPEPATYGLMFLGACLGLFGWRKWRKSKA